MGSESGHGKAFNVMSLGKSFIEFKYNYLNVYLKHKT